MANRIIHTTILILLISFGISAQAVAQWGAPYANHWINYDQQYVKIAVTERGVQSIPFSALPKGFPIGEPDKFQIFYRGKELSIISTDNQQIKFFAVPNDGALDSLLYRPMSSRLNKFSSLFSKKAAYFLTVGSKLGRRASKIAQTVAPDLASASYHVNRSLQTYSDIYSLSGEEHSVPDYRNSYFEKGASWTGVRQLGNVFINFPFHLPDWDKANDLKPKLELLVQGMTNSSRGIEVYIGKSAGSLRQITTINLEGFVGKKYEFQIESTDLLDNGDGILTLKSNSILSYERFSVAYYKITFPQKLKMQDLSSRTFYLPAVNVGSTKVAIEGIKSGTPVYDISDFNDLKIVAGSNSEFIVPRIKQQEVTLFASDEIISLDSSKLASVIFNKINPADYNYIFITNELLAPSVNSYADYRKSSDGGGYRTLVVKIKDIYNQFGDGEVSPLAIRNFVDYMISDGDRSKYLFLIAKSVNVLERMPEELDECVPAVGYPSSDILLVEGLGGVPTDMPAIPVGRLVAISPQQVADYLTKVKDYERNSSNSYGWRKRILHLNGGHTTEEINQFKTLLSAVTPLAENGQLGGEVEPVVKQSTIEVESVNISAQINEGAGMFSYFGHGSRTKTDLDFGYVSDPARGFNNTYKYPLMYFNGCGVGNIFRDLFGTNLTALDCRPLTLDWILSPQKGAISIIANSSSSYVSPTVKYLNSLYTTLFADPKTAQLTIGQIQQETIRKIIAGSTNFYDVTNIHQSVLQGDPTLHLINVDKPDYAVDPDKSIILYADQSGKTIGNSTNIKTAIVLSNWGMYKKEEKVPLQIKYTFADGSSETVDQSVAAVAYRDTVFLNLSNKKEIRGVSVRIDKANTLSELDKTNNSADLSVDWSIAKGQSVYPTVPVKDIVPPLLSVTFNERSLKNGEVIDPNPLINFTLQDDRLLPAGDSTLLDIFLKPCGDGSCDFIRLNYSDKQFQLLTLADRTIQIKYTPTNMKVGEYEFLVNARDASGNTAEQPFRIRYEIRENNGEVLAVVSSPNPASTYIRFSASGYNAETLQSIQFSIYNSLGILVDQRDISALKSGNLIEWYWLPKIAASGLYLYKAVFRMAKGTEQQIFGKVVLIR